LGCNVGRNLFCLWQAGYKNISGIELNKHALEVMRTSFPVIDRESIYNGFLEDILPELEDRKFDIIFSLAVLEHVHPNSRISSLVLPKRSIKPTKYSLCFCPSR